MQTLAQLQSGELRGITQLKLSCGLREFPREIFDLADSLEILDLSGNDLSTLPDDFSRLARLRILFCSFNQFTVLPPVLSECASLTMVGFKGNRIHTVPKESLAPQLRWLILTDNAIKALPDAFGQCRSLQKLMLAGNRLQQIPASLAGCTALELIRLSANALECFPDFLLALPRLCWLAFAGNPFSVQAEAGATMGAQLPCIPWSDLAMGPLLGQGASGHIYRASYTGAQAWPAELAVKVFKGEMTSDGLPRCERAAAIRAGHHVGLPVLRAQVTGHPQGAMALVMGLISPDYTVLAGPPSFESCTRDVYAEHSRYDLAWVLGIAQQIAAVGRHLHQRGIMHGDLYAHNILTLPTGQALLSDFGAASFYVPDQGARALAMQRMEVRAMACLVRELLDRCEPAPSEEAVFQGLARLTQTGLTERIYERPLFHEWEARLSELSLGLPLGGLS